MYADALTRKAGQLLASCRDKGITIAAAESCTGGLLCGLLTEIPGSSAVFERGYVTYSNQAKIESLGVAKTLIEKHGAVSSEVALAMAKGTLRHSTATLAVAITGIAGPPSGDPSEKPVGLVYIAVATPKSASCEKYSFIGDRTGIRLQSVDKALDMMIAAL
jgi:nicotinamide-nucleotide amidase